MKIKELIAKPENWTTKVAARDATGASVHPESQKATCYCLIGALVKCYPGAYEWQTAWSKLNYEIRRFGYVELKVFNDTATHAEVLALVTKLDI